MCKDEKQIYLFITCPEYLLFELHSEIISASMKEVLKIVKLSAAEANYKWTAYSNIVKQNVYKKTGFSTL